MSRGRDSVRSSIDYALGANVENLVLIGAAQSYGTGNDSANIITGNALANTLDGGAGTDLLEGGAGDDTLIGGAGADFLNGGAGIDWVDYSAGGAGVIVDLEDNQGIGGDAEGDTFTSIENVRGTGFRRRHCRDFRKQHVGGP